jgi:chemotaxis family two-component system response regulator PixG
MIDTKFYPRYLSNPRPLNLQPEKRLPNPVNSQNLVEFNALVQSHLFSKLKKQEFTGKLVLKSPHDSASVIYFYLGRLIYAEGGIHPLRRWHRHLQEYCPQITNAQDFLNLNLKKINGVGQEYTVLGYGIQEKIIHREQVIYLIRSVISEVLFDLTQVGRVSYKIVPERYILLPIVTINPEQAITQVWKMWQAWQDAKLGDHSPNSAPIIKSVELLKARTSALTFQCLQQRINGQKTLRDLAVELNQDLLLLTRSLMLYVQWGLVDLLAIPDLLVTAPNPPIKSVDHPLVYLTRDLEQGQRLQRVLAAQGKHLVVINHNSLEAIAQCLESKPTAIFMSSQSQPLDGYEICYQLRQVTPLRTTPIFVITEEQKSLKDKIRAKMVGATELIEQSSLCYAAPLLLAQYNTSRK